MKRKLVTFFLAASCSIGGVLMTGCHTERKPEIAFESLSHEFPNVFIVGSKVLKRFDFTNKGNAPLEIRDIKTNCGCVATTTSSSPIPPGGTGGIHIEIDREVGDFRDQIFVYTNDPEKPMVPLQVSGVIKAPITFPKHIDVGQLEKGQSVTKRVTLTNNLSHPVEITAPKVSDDSLAVTLPEPVIPAGGSVAIQVILSVNRVGFYSEVLTFSAQAPAGIHGPDSETLELSISFQGRVLGGIEVLPANLFLGVLSPNHPVQRKVQLKTDGTLPFAVLGIAADLFEVSAEGDTEKQTSHELFLSISVKGEPKGFVEDTLSIQTDHPDVPTIDISVKGVIP